jgi:hypothetical protein
VDERLDGGRHCCDQTRDGNIAQATGDEFQ